ncbi:MAG: hypothetical protein HY815_33875 [Candidatus Riflebacteria bacterium]|nr:hypothetical protein [Candidatus Riflebacteria bacterium]
MKDPLALEQTPYDVLGIDPALRQAIARSLQDLPAANQGNLQSRVEQQYRAQVDQAFTRALKERVPHQKAKRARDTLLKATGRAAVALFEYPDDALLRITTGQGPAALSPKVRLTTAVDWETHLKGHLDDAEAAHCLALLWVHWVRYEETRYRAMVGAIPPDDQQGAVAGRNKAALLERVHRSSGRRFAPDRDRCCADEDCPWRGDFLSSAPDVTRMWYCVIGFWSLLAARPSYLTSRFALSKTEAHSLIDGQTRALGDELLDHAESLENAPEATRYRVLELFLMEEIRSARTLGAAGLKVSGVTLPAGPRLLAHLGLREELSRGLETLRKGPGRPEVLEALGLDPTPYGALSRLVREGKPDRALKAIEALPEDERRAPEPTRLTAEVFKTLGQRLDRDGKFDEALAAWSRGLAAAPSDRGLEEEIVRATRAQVRYLIETQRESEAIATLDRVVKILPTAAELKTELARQRYDRAAPLLAAVRGRIARHPITLADLQTVSELVSDLESSVELGLDRARADLEWALGVVEEMSPGGQSNQRARSRLDAQKGRRRRLGFRTDDVPLLLDLLSEFQTAARHGSRRARINVLEVERLLARVRAAPGDRCALAAADRERLREARGADGPGVDDIDALEELLGDFELCRTGGHRGAYTRTAEVRQLLARLLVTRAEGKLTVAFSGPVAQHRMVATFLKRRPSRKTALGVCPLCLKPERAVPGRWTPLRLPDGQTVKVCPVDERVLRLCSALPSRFESGVLALVCQAQNDLARAMTLDPLLETAGRRLIEVREILGRSGRMTAGAASYETPATTGGSGSAIVANLAMVAFVLFVIWLIYRSFWWAVVALLAIFLRAFDPGDR